jgi:2-succinyl-5-enolpyruvyl-6-hydroxy-3-cyclohexene-1-carboxylate synthase
MIKKLCVAYRGTSGIDGCTSTAIGHALSTSKMVTLVSGDMAFLYDSNGFWCNPLPKNLRVIVINNEGGNIFRIIKGPRHDSTFETYQETTHTLKAKGVASTFNIPYISAANFEELNEALPNFFKESEGPKILEVFTPRMESPEILKEYFQYLKENS